MLPNTAEYALRAVYCLATHTESSATEVVSSRDGSGGGYALPQATDEVNFLDVNNAVVPLKPIASCPLDLKSHTSVCPLRDELDKAFAALESAFATVAIRQLLESRNPIVPLREVLQ